MESADWQKRIEGIPCSFAGDDPGQGHRVRDSPQVRAGTPTESFDVVIIGGGISGLTTAYSLLDMNILVLEKDDLPGGAAKRKEWNGVRYTLGSTNVRLGYEVDLKGKKFDFLTPFFDDLGVRWKKVRQPTDSFFVDGKLVRDVLGEGLDELPYDQSARDEFREAWKYLTGLINSEDCPVIPVEANNPKSMELDGRSFANLLSSFGSKVQSFVDLMSRSIFGEGSHEVSAFAALCYLRGEFSDQYGAPGGNALLSEALTSRLRERIRTRCIVAGIEQNDSSAYVTYLNDDHEPITIRCKALVYAASKHIAPRIFKDLSSYKTEAINSMRFDAYFVANLFCDNTVYNESFAVYCDDAIFTDIVVNDWLSDGGNTGGGQVLSLFCPRGIDGRDELLSNPCNYWAPLILRDLERYIPGSVDKVAGVEICRYGHHFAVPYPGFITGAREIVKRPDGRYFFAKDDTQGVPCLESAVWSGMEAASDVRERLLK